MACADRVLEEDREVVDHSVATRKLLHHLGSGTKEQTTAMLCLAAGEEYLEWSAVTITTAHSNGVGDNVELTSNLFVLNWQVCKRCHDDPSFLGAFFSHEPSGRLGQSKCKTKNDESEHQLEGDREPPSQLGWAVKTSKIDPVGDQRSNGYVSTLDTDELSAVVALGALSLVGRDSRCVDSVADASEETADDELCSRTGTLTNDTTGSRYAGNLDDHTDDHSPSADEDRFAAAEPVT